MSKNVQKTHFVPPFFLQEWESWEWESWTPWSRFLPGPTCTCIEANVWYWGHSCSVTQVALRNTTSNFHPPDFIFTLENFTPRVKYSLGKKMSENAVPFGGKRLWHICIIPLDALLFSMIDWMKVSMAQPLFCIYKKDFRQWCDEPKIWFSITKPEIIFGRAVYYKQGTP